MPKSGLSVGSAVPAVKQPGVAQRRELLLELRARPASSRRANVAVAHEAQAQVNLERHGALQLTHRCPELLGPEGVGDMLRLERREDLQDLAGLAVDHLPDGMGHYVGIV